MRILQLSLLTHTLHTHFTAQLHKRQTEESSWQVSCKLHILDFILFSLFSECLCLFRPGVPAGCRPVCGPPVAAAAQPDVVLSVEEEEEEEEEPESVRGAALYGTPSPSMLCSGDPGVAGLLGRVRTTKNILIVLKYCVTWKDQS